MKRTMCMAVTAAAMSLGAQEFDLAGVWQLTQVETNSVTCKMAVPGGIFTALYNAKFIPDPYFAQNEKVTQWPGRVEWDVERTFNLPAVALGHKSLILRLEDVDCFADVYVNEKKVGETFNRFRRWDFDIKSTVKEGENKLRLRFRSTENISYAEAKKYPLKYNIANATVKNVNLVRTVQCHGGWDWGITQMDTGIMGSARLISTDIARIDYAYTEQDFAPDYSSVDVKTIVEAYSPAGGETELGMVLGEVIGRRDVSLKSGMNRLEISVKVNNPKLWWPNEAGEQNLYRFSVSLGESSFTRQLGLRKMEVINDLDKEPDPVDGKKGRQMTIAVNGKRIFAKGADWIPCDAFENRQRGKYAQLLGDAKACHMNIVRVWGGGQFEHPEFYELCDKLGIMIWHDFMFSCATYPSTQEFLDNVCEETRHQVKRLRDYASIALWCGDNECLGAIGWFDSSKGKDRQAYVDDWKAKVDALDAVCRECDPRRIFWPSSPCLGPGNLGDGWKDDSSGDMHFWGVWFGGAYFTLYHGVRPRFCSEFGYQSYPSIETALTYVTPDQLNPTAPDFFYHQKSPNGNKYILETMMVYFRYPNGVKSVHYLSQVQQAMAIRTGVEHFRHIMPRCMGSIYWQLNDNWPVASWSSIEYGGKWKHLQYHAKRFYAPSAIMIEPAYKDTNTLEYWVVNDRDEPLKGEAKLSTLTFAGENALPTKTFKMNVPARTAVKLASFPVDSFGTPEERRNRFISISADNCPDNDYQLQFYRESNLCVANVKSEIVEKDDKWLVTLSTDAPAFFVWADVAGIRGTFSDNSFTLLPGQPKTIVFTKREDESADFAAFKRAFSVMHLRETY